MKMRDRVRDEARKETERSKSTGSWYQESITFNHWRNLAEHEAIQKAYGLLEQLPIDRERIRNLNQKRNDIIILCANLFIEGASKPISISRNKKDYVKSPFRRASWFIIELIDLMKEGEWIDQKIGFYNQNNKKESRISRIWPKKKFLDYFSTIPLIEYMPQQLVVQLRDRNHKIITYKNTPETNRIQSVLQHANLVNRTALVQYRRQLRKTYILEHLNTDLHAVFHNESFKLGGRLYTSGNSYQILSGRQRRNITINNQLTVELDFSGLHPRLLYALEGIQFNDDPYIAICSDYPDLRPFVKELLLALLNAKSIVKAVASGNNKLRREYELLTKLRERNISVAELIRRFTNAHPKIEHYFGKQVGFELMHLDAKIALDIVEEFTSRNIPILSIHDSFIVTKDKRDELEIVMRDSYKKHTKGFNCPIKTN